MLTKVQKWGNSLAIRIPKTYAEEAGMDIDTPVDVRMERQALKIVVKSRKSFEKLTLDDLLAKVTKKNRHDEIDFGEPAGKEIW